MGEAYFANKRVATGGLIKGSKELIKGLRTGASTVVKEGGEYVIRKAVVSNLDEIRNIAKIMDDFPNLRALGNNAESLAEKLLKASDGDTQILSRLNSLPDKTIETFAKDFSQADDILAKFAKDPDLIKAWGKAISSGDDDLVKAINSLNDNADELEYVLRNVDDVDAAGGYKVWKGNALPSLIRQLASKPGYKPLRIIWSKENKTITLIGKWDEIIEGQQRGLKKVFEELSEVDLNIYLQSGKFDHPGGFNMLSIEDWSTKVIQKAEAKGIKIGTKAFDDFIWEVYNKPWLESAMQRGDDIVIWSNPQNLPMKEFKDGIGKTFYERELEFIKENCAKYGYDYNVGVNLGTFSK